MKKRVLSVLLILCMILIAAPAVFADSESESGIMTQEELQTALNEAAEAESEEEKIVVLTNDIEVNDSSLGKNQAVLTVPEGVTLDGQNHFIMVNEDWVGENKNHILSVENAENGATIKNVVIVGNEKTKSGIHVYQSKKVVLENVTIKDCGNAGLVVNGSEVTAKGLKTDGNKWGAVNVDKEGAKFHLNSGTLAEEVQIWSELEEPPVFFEETGLYETFLGGSEDDGDLKGYTYYTTDPAKLGEAVVVSSENTVKTVYRTIESAVEKAETGSEIRILKDVEIESTLKIEGKEITIKGNEIRPQEISSIERLLEITGGAKVRLEDIVIDGMKTAGCVSVEASGLVIEEGTVIKNGIAKYGGGIYYKSGTSLTMNGGIIQDNEATGGYGGGIYYGNSSGGFTMNGGTITGNKASYYAGGVWIASTAKMVMTDGQITGNHSAHGADVFVNANSSSDPQNTGLKMEKGAVGEVWVEYYEGQSTSFQYQDGTIETIKMPLDGNYNAVVSVDTPSAGQIYEGGHLKEGQNVTIDGDTALLDGIIIPENTTLTIPNGTTATVSGAGITNRGGLLVNGILNADENVETPISGDGQIGIGKEGNFDIADENDDYFKVTLKANGGVCTFETIKVKSGKTVMLPEPVRNGYNFKGWYDGSGQKADASYTVTGNTELTAQWSKKSGGSSAGGSFVQKYAVNAETAKNGKITVSVSNASEGTSVTITALPDNGYELTTLTVTDAFGKTVLIKSSGNNQYIFAMPSSKVTVSAVFTEEKKTDETLPFLDVSAEDWFFDAIQYTYENDMMSGISKTEFGPELNMDRGMIVTILYRLEKEPEAGKAVFSDIEDGQYYAKAVAWASVNNIVNGYGENLFGPTDPITREQLAAILYRYSVYKDYNLSGSGVLSAFSDEEKVSSYAETAMQWAIGNNLISGMGDSMLIPQGNATRAQAAMIFMRYCEQLGQN